MHAHTLYLQEYSVLSQTQHQIGMDDRILRLCVLASGCRGDNVLTSGQTQASNDRPDLQGVVDKSINSILPGRAHNSGMTLYRPCLSESVLEGVSAAWRFLYISQSYRRVLHWDPTMSLCQLAANGKWPLAPHPSEDARTGQESGTHGTHGGCFSICRRRRQKWIDCAWCVCVSVWL